MKNRNSENVMRKIKIEKVVLNIGGTAEGLDKGFKLLKILTGKKPAKIKSKKRIPTWGVRPGLEVGTVVTLKQISENNFSFGIKEYIEIPGVEYQRDIGIIGFDVTIVFKRSGRRVALRKMKRGKVSKKQTISKEEIIKFMEENFQTKFL
jgi:large subunit ribosomal protein L5